jgi:hypothetical protein
MPEYGTMQTLLNATISVTEVVKSYRNTLFFLNSPPSMAYASERRGTRRVKIKRPTPTLILPRQGGGDVLLKS